MRAVMLCDSFSNGQARIFEAYLKMLDKAFGDIKLITLSRRSSILSTVPPSMDVLQFPMSKVFDESDGWPEYIDKCYDFLSSNGIDTMFVYSAPMFSGKNYGYEKAVEKTIKRMKWETHLCTNFNTMKWYYMRLQFINACSIACKNVYHQVYDPQEIDYSGVFGFMNYDELVDIQVRSRVRTMMPFYEVYSFSEEQNQIEHDGRDIAFTFGASAVSDDRAFLISFVDELESKLGPSGLECNVSLRTKRSSGREVVRFIDQRQYVDELKNSSSTLLVPAYDENAFSLARLVESAGKGCVPFVYETCCLDSISRVYPELTKLIEGELIVRSPDDLLKHIELSRDDAYRSSICKKIEGCFASRHVLDIQWLVDRWNKLPAAL